MAELTAIKGSFSVQHPDLAAKGTEALKAVVQEIHSLTKENLNMSGYLNEALFGINLGKPIGEERGLPIGPPSDSPESYPVLPILMIVRDLLRENFQQLEEIRRQIVG